MTNMKVKGQSQTRPYRQVARAEAAAATGERILDAAAEIWSETPIDQMTLDQVASRAGVTVQTVIRRFGGKDLLIAAVFERVIALALHERDQAPPGDIAAIVRVLSENYEVLGDKVLKLLGEEPGHPIIREATEGGRRSHRDWCSRVFAPFLERVEGVDRKRLLAQLVAVCDVQTWKLLRRDARLSRKQTEQALAELLERLLESAR